MRVIPALLAASAGVLMLAAPATATTEAMNEPTAEELRVAPIAEEPVEADGLGT
ncbi:hypothetical protein [Nonomuraea sp. NPDC049758]|uniref:hypothetical protein n=1 Tax=Nonomuraea sp. NPDC049758 TaxID=3154360 RepID=UPI00342AC233